MVISDLLQGCPNNSDADLLHKIVTNLTTQHCNNIVRSCLYQSCWNNLVTSLIVPSSLLQVVNSMFQTCCQQFGTSRANTTCSFIHLDLFSHSSLSIFTLFPIGLCYNLFTRVKTHKLLQVCKQVVTSLFASCQQVVFALLVPGLLQQVWNNFLTTSNKLDGIIRLVTRLF